MAEGEAGSERGDRGWVMLAALIALYILNAFDRTVLSLMVGHVKSDLGATDAQIGLVLGIAFALFYGAFGLPLGSLVDRYQRRLVLFGGVVIWSLATIACGYAQSFGHLLAGRMLLGIGEAALMPAAHSLLADRFPPARLSTALSIFYMGGVVGNSGSAAVGGLAVAHFGQVQAISLAFLPPVRGWQYPFVLVGVLGLAMAFLAFAFREPPRRGGHGSDDAAVSWLGTIRRRRAVLASIAGSFVVYAMLLYAAVLWTPAYMARTFGWTPAQIGPWYALVHLGGAGAGTLFFGHLVDRLAARGHRDAHLRVMLGCLTVGGPLGIAAFLMTDPYAFMILECLYFFCCFSFSGYAAAAVQAITPAGGRGRMAALYLLLIIIVGNGLGPWLIGVLTDSVFGDEQRLGASFLLMIVVLTPIAILSAWAGLKPMREAVTGGQPATASS